MSFTERYNGLLANFATNNRTIESTYCRKFFLLVRLRSWKDIVVKNAWDATGRFHATIRLGALLAGLSQAEKAVLDQLFAPVQATAAASTWDQLQGFSRGQPRRIEDHQWYGRDMQPLAQAVRDIRGQKPAASLPSSSSSSGVPPVGPYGFRHFINVKMPHAAPAAAPHAPLRRFFDIPSLPAGCTLLGARAQLNLLSLKPGNEIVRLRAPGAPAVTARNLMQAIHHRIRRSLDENTVLGFVYHNDVRVYSALDLGPDQYGSLQSRSVRKAYALVTAPEWTDILRREQHGDAFHASEDDAAVLHPVAIRGFLEVRYTTFRHVDGLDRADMLANIAAHPLTRHVCTLALVARYLGHHNRRNWEYARCAELWSPKFRSDGGLTSNQLISCHTIAGGFVPGVFGPDHPSEAIRHMQSYAGPAMVVLPCPQRMFV